MWLMAELGWVLGDSWGASARQQPQGKRRHIDFHLHLSTCGHGEANKHI